MVIVDRSKGIIGGIPYGRRANEVVVKNVVWELTVVVQKIDQEG